MRRMYSRRASRIGLIEQLLVSNTGGVTTRELSERFGVSERMIYLDISRLRANGTPITGTPGPGGGIALDRTGRKDAVPRKPSDETPEVFGYQDERRRLTELLSSAFRGRPSTAAILGELGAGKSYITRDLARQAEAMGFTVLNGNSLERSDAPPYWSLASILDGISGLRVPRAAATRFAGSIEILEQAFPTSARSKRVRTRLQNTVSLRDQLQVHEAARLVLETAAHLNPLLIAIEDLQWADESSLDLVYHLAHSIESVPIFIVTTVRTPLEELSVGGGSTLKKLLASSRTTAVTLGTISERDAEKLMHRSWPRHAKTCLYPSPQTQLRGRSQAGF